MGVCRYKCSCFSSYQLKNVTMHCCKWFSNHTTTAAFPVMTAVHFHTQESRVNRWKCCWLPDTGCAQNTEKACRTLKMVFHDFPWLFMCIFQYIPGPFMSIFHVFPGLFNWVDIEQVRFSYNNEYVTQFTIILNNRLNRVWQWTIIIRAVERLIFLIALIARLIILIAR